MNEVNTYTPDEAQQPQPIVAAENLGQAQQLLLEQPNPDVYPKEVALAEEMAYAGKEERDQAAEAREKLKLIGEGVLEVSNRDEKRIARSGDYHDANAEKLEEEVKTDFIANGGLVIEDANVANEMALAGDKWRTAAVKQRTKAGVINQRIDYKNGDVSDHLGRKQAQAGNAANSNDRVADTLEEAARRKFINEQKAA
jgi:hypothetical protein